MIIRPMYIAALCVAAFLATTGNAVEIQRSVKTPAPHFYLADIMGGIGQTALSNLFSVPRDEYTRANRVFTLGDGTQLGALYFPTQHPEKSPLIIANFGLFTNRRSHPAAGFIRYIIKSGQLHASVLIVDSATSAAFFIRNGELSIGGYDEGRILVELADALVKSGVHFSSLHLLGVSLGGNAVLQALIEDARLGGKRFSSAMVFNAVLNEEESSQAVLSAFGHPLAGLPEKEHYGLEGWLIIDTMFSHFNDKLLARGEPPAPPPWQTKGEFFYTEFESRLQTINLGMAWPMNPSWNHMVATDSVEDYIRTSSALAQQQIDRIHVPVIVVQSKNDPIVPYEQFTELQNAEIKNPYIETLSTSEGGHWGFMATYGPKWVRQLVQRMLRSASQPLVEH